MRPKAEYLIATINALCRVVNQLFKYLMTSHTRYRSEIDDFNLLINRRIIKYSVYRQRLVVNQEQLTMRPKAELLIAMINAPNRVDNHYLTSRDRSIDQQLTMLIVIYTP